MCVCACVGVRVCEVVLIEEACCVCVVVLIVDLAYVSSVWES